MPTRPAFDPNAALMPARLRVSGKFLRIGDAKVRLRGISYGPFHPNTAGAPFPEDSQLTSDLEHLGTLQFDTIRLYDPPSDHLLKEAQRLSLGLIVGIPWADHVDFLRDPTLQATIISTVRDTATRLKDHPCVVAFLVGNEIEKTLVRWMGPPRVQKFLEQLIAAGRECAPNQLFSYATYPSTEYLIPRNADFLAVNVYLEQPAAFQSYLQRLHHIAGNQPLLITEFGLDAAVHGESAQAETRHWFEQICAESAVAGTIWFSYTDEWFRGGEKVTGWQFGIVNEARKERSCAHSEAQQKAPKKNPSISVIVCTYNGGATLHACLTSLKCLSYPNYEVLLIDDGSVKEVCDIARDFPNVRYIRQEHAGLSVARNLGAARAFGDIVAYTDDDCIADEDWLNYLAAGFDDPQWVACGGPNIPPPARSQTESVVACAPGAPSHVLLNDIEAEHLPGCNLAIRKSALEAIGGFDPIYCAAGDDVDICWRLREAGGSLRFIPGAMVWHHRRYTVSAYLRQQCGYGKAEALLMKKHPQRFGWLGGARWSGAIYGDAAPTANPVEGSIYHGPLGNGLFQGIYQQSPQSTLDLFSGVLGLLFLVLAAVFKMPLLVLMLLGAFIVSAFERMQQQARRAHSLSFIRQIQLLYLYVMQPIKREQSRLFGLIEYRVLPHWQAQPKGVSPPSRPKPWSLTLKEQTFWNEEHAGRDRFLEELRLLIQSQGGSCQTDDGWQRNDLEMRLTSWLSITFLTVTEYHGNGRCLTRVRAMGRTGLLGMIPRFACHVFLRQKAIKLINQSAQNSGLSDDPL
jgi:hypothetical protein